MEKKGLTSEEVAKLKAAGKFNKEYSDKTNSYLNIFLRNAATPFNTILIILGIALAICGSYLSAVAATGVILLNIFISTIQEWKAKRRLDKIAVLTRTKAFVIRDGEETSIDKAEIVLGDLIHLKPGDQALVDGEIIECDQTEIDESLLTGESKTIRKNVGDTIYSGSACVSGDCYYTVTKVGEDTFSQKMTSAARKFERKKTPLQKETNAITEILMGLAFFFIFIQLILNIFRGIFSVTSFLEETVVILDIVPIALFLLITITYMVAAVRMADSGVLLQNSTSVESMSHVDTICMDKTGTITTNNLVFNETTFVSDENRAKKFISEICGQATNKNQTLQTIQKEYGTAECTLLGEIHFSSARKYSAVRVKGDTTDTIFLGAWNVLRQYCENPEPVDGIVSSYSSRGLRTVIICDGNGVEIDDQNSEKVPPLVPLAIISIRDEVREDQKQIINEFTSNGMDIKVISGDDPKTVDALFSLAEIPGERKIVSGDELQKLSEEEFEKKALETNIFGRMKPEQKEDVIRALRKNGRYVAMVGDGVNDVRSIKSANVGIAMETGASAARGQADMILLGDKFGALPKAMIEGKRTVSGMRDILRLYISRNFTLALLVLVMLILFGVTPMLPIQNTLYAVMTVSFASLLLTFWAKPSENKELILPKVIRYSIPISISTAFVGMLVYLFIIWECKEGIIDLDQTINSMVDVLRTADIKIGNIDFFTPEGLIDYITGNNPAELEMCAGTSAMLFFLIGSGITQLFLLFPLSKRLSFEQNNYRKTLMPSIFGALMLLLLIAIIFAVPQYTIPLFSFVIFEPMIYLQLAGIILSWYALMFFVLRSKYMNRLNDWTVKITNDMLDKENKKFILVMKKKNGGR